MTTGAVVLLFLLWTLLWAFLTLYIIGRSRSADRDKDREYIGGLNSQIERIGDRLCRNESQDHQLYLLMNGVSKRISEVREIAELIEERAPDLYQQCPWVIGWLASTDKYLCDLRNVMRPLGVDARWDEERARFERFMPLPDRLGKHSVYAKWPHDADGTIIPANDHV